MVAAQSRCSISGTITHAAASSEPPATIAARSAPREDRGAGDERPQQQREQRQIAGLEMQRDRQRDQADRREVVAASRIARQPYPQASGSVSDAHSCVHTPNPFQRYACCS